MSFTISIEEEEEWMRNPQRCDRGAVGEGGSWGSVTQPERKTWLETEHQVPLSPV